MINKLTIQIQNRLLLSKQSQVLVFSQIKHIKITILSSIISNIMQVNMVLQQANLQLITMLIINNSITREELLPMLSPKQMQSSNKHCHLLLTMQVELMASLINDDLLTIFTLKFFKKGQGSDMMRQKWFN